MAVDQADIRLVRDSLPRIRERLVPASMTFYDNLFAIEPELRALFRVDLASQGMRFMSTLATIADVLGMPRRWIRSLRISRKRTRWWASAPRISRLWARR